MYIIMLSLKKKEIPDILKFLIIIETIISVNIFYY